MTERAARLWIVDGIEEGIARVTEDGARTFTVPMSILPNGIHEGAVLTVVYETGERDDVRLLIAIDGDATARARLGAQSAIERAKARWRRDDPGGDVSL